MAIASEPPRPVSAVSQSAALASLFGALAVLVIFKWIGNADATTCLITVIFFVALPHMASVVASWQSPPSSAANWSRYFVKLYGQLGVFGCLALAYFVFQGFFENFLVPLTELGKRVALPVIVAMPIYIWVTDQNMTQPEDGLYQFGLCLLGKFSMADPVVVQQFLLGWAVKGFFGPLMAGFALNDMSWFLEFPISGGLQNGADIYAAAYRMFFFIDVIFAMTGYLCTFRLLNTHIRSTDPTMFGWVVCILCYPPFWGLFVDNFLNYEDGYYWGEWLNDSPIIWSCWAALITFSMLIYTWTEVSFGIRFSNLTNRGTLTNGPYRWMKHPAYVTKNISWWLIAIPFLSNGGLAAGIRNCIALALVNYIYYLRAKTEERHLLRDPDYVAYSIWMERNSLYAKLKILILGKLGWTKP